MCCLGSSSLFKSSCSILLMRSLRIGSTSLMMRDEIERGSRRIRLFTTEERKETLDRIIAALKSDDRIIGVVVVGSGATLSKDRYSDIDLAVVVDEEENVLVVFTEWRSIVEDLFSVIHSFEVTYGEHEYLYGFLLEGFLELDMGFRCLSKLYAKDEKWRILFDQTGKMQSIMQSSMEERHVPDIEPVCKKKVDTIWYYIIHGVVALKRGKLWEAFNCVETIRNHTIELAGLCLGLKTKRFKEVDRMPKSFLNQVQNTLVPTMDLKHIKNALRRATLCFFHEANHIENMNVLETSRTLETRMKEYLDINDI